MLPWKNNELNDEQKKAVENSGNIFLVACPGSGKTRTLTFKIAYELSRLKSNRKYIIGITYTNRAANEIHERIENMGIDTTQLWIGTIHAFCLEWIIKPYSIYSEKLKHGYRVISSYDSEKLLHELCKPYKEIKIWDCGYTLTSSKCELHCKDPKKTSAVKEIRKQYFRTLGKRKQIDFELILYNAYKLVELKPIIGSLLSNLFEYILIDEYQDTKQIQYAILARIIRASHEKTKLFIVGDPNQAIYTNLGGYPISVEELSNMCGVEFISLSLERNYRSSSKIILVPPHFV